MCDLRAKQSVQEMHQHLFTSDASKDPLIPRQETKKPDICVSETEFFFFLTKGKVIRKISISFWMNFTENFY